MKQDEKTLLLIGGGAVAIYLLYDSVIAPVLETIGIKKSKEEKTIEQAATNPNSAFSPVFWQWEQRNKGKAVLIKADAVNKMVRDIQKAISSIASFSDFPAVLAVFRQLSYKSQVSFLADQFQKQTGKDLLTYLRGRGLIINDGLTDQQLNTIINLVNGLK